MKLVPEDIKVHEKIGTSSKGEIWHIATKGGYSLIVCKSPSGALKVLGDAAHPGLARHMAGQVEKSIQWDESLFKSEHNDNGMMDLFELLSKAEIQQKDGMGYPMYDSTPDKHLAMAQFLSRRAGTFTGKDHDSGMMRALDEDRAMAHYKASGMDDNTANEAHKANMQEPHDNSKPPFDDYGLQLSFQRKHGIKFPTGSKFSPTKD